MKILRTIILLVLPFFLVACASTPGSVELLSKNFDSKQSAQFDKLQLSVNPKNGAKLNKIDTDRIRSKIINNIKQENASRFQFVDTPSTNTLKADLEIRDYDEGNAFARFMLAGLGQMHINGDLILTNPSTNEMLAQYGVSKTFAWGGIYGASKNLTDIEEGFCQAVSDVLLNKAE